VTRRPLSLMMLGALLTAAALPIRPVGAVSGDRPPVTTVVSLTFDDGSADEYAVRPILAGHDMTATFFIISDLTGRDSYYMTWDQVRALADDGNEIGGHTLDHVNLTKVDAAEKRRQVCQDRRNLMGRGFSVTDFAYPEAAVDADAEAAVKECGYDSGRTVGDVQCDGCASAESIPPPDPYRTRTPDGITATTTLPTVEGWVTDAEQHGGGWIQLVFHRICDLCGEHAFRQQDFEGLLDWLRPRAAQGTVVRTVRDALRGPAVAPAPPPGFDPTAGLTATPGTEHR